VEGRLKRLAADVRMLKERLGDAATAAAAGGSRPQGQVRDGMPAGMKRHAAACSSSSCYCIRGPSFANTLGRCMGKQSRHGGYVMQILLHTMLQQPNCTHSECTPSKQCMTAQYMCLLCCRVAGVCVEMETTPCWLPSRWVATGAWHVTGHWAAWTLAQGHTCPQVRLSSSGDSCAACSAGRFFCTIRTHLVAVSALPRLLMCLLTP
jgi:hypothetical protein